RKTRTRLRAGKNFSPMFRSSSENSAPLKRWTHLRANRQARLSAHTLSTLQRDADKASTAIDAHAVRALLHHQRARAAQARLSVDRDREHVADADGEDVQFICGCE